MRCTANVHGGGQCKAWAVKGATTCRMHSGTSRRVRAAAQRRLDEEKARKAMVTYGLPLDVDPAEAILNEIRWTAGHVEWLRGIVQSLEPEQVAWGTAEEQDKQASEFPGTDTIRKAAPNAYVLLYQQERKHLVDVCST